MPDSANFALHRPELQDALLRGEKKMGALMQGSAARYRGGRDTLLPPIRIIRSCIECAQAGRVARVR